MNSNSSGRRLEGFFTGKGFYIVLFLCAAVIGLSAWMMAAGNEAMEDLNAKNSIGIGSNRVETVIIPPVAEDENLAPVIAPDESQLQSTAAADEDAMPVWQQEEVEAVQSPLWLWPVSGELERGHDIENLNYDVTLNDWRTHDGIDICAEQGTPVAASCAGTVIELRQDSLYGTVLSIDHGNGLVSIYANLEEKPYVSVGELLEAGDIIGTVGSTALCESAQSSHLHFAMQLDGLSANPLEYLPA